MLAIIVPSKSVFVAPLSPLFNFRTFAAGDCIFCDDESGVIFASSIGGGGGGGISIGISFGSGGKPSNGGGDSGVLGMSSGLMTRGADGIGGAGKTASCNALECNEDTCTGETAASIAWIRSFGTAGTISKSTLALAVVAFSVVLCFSDDVE